MKISLTNITRIHGDQTVLSIPKWQFSSGEIIGISGPNGAGKTTLLRILAGLDQSDGGELLFDEKPLTPELLLKITMVFQRPGLLKRSVWQNIAYPLMLRKISPKEIQTRVDNIMEILNLHPFKSRLPNQLSRGEAQKVTLARAMVFSPEVLLLDEPFASLDEQSITIVTSLIQKLHKTGSTIFVISHDRQLLDKISTQRVKIEAGILTSLT